MNKLLLISTIALGLTACNDSDGPNVSPDNNKPQLNIILTAEESKTITNTNNFGFHLFDAISSEVGEQNVFFSPLIASLNLSILANGAAGDTRAEILTALGVTEGQIADLNSTMNKIVTALPDADNKTKLSLASSVWLVERCSPTISFSNTINDYFKSDTYTFKYQSPSLASDINKWCADKTGGAIKQLVSQSEMDECAFCVLSAAVFNGQWSQKFQGDTFKENFTCADGSEVSVDMMHDKSDYFISVSESLSMLVKSFGNKSFNIAFLLPDDNVSLNDAIASLDAESWNSLFSAENRKIYDITLSVPRLDFSTEYDLIPFYEKLGINSAISADLADFSEVIKENVFLNLSRQKAKFKMDEQGATAVAAQIDEIVFSSAGALEPKEFKLNKPFAFIIYETVNKTILFAGKVEKP